MSSNANLNYEAYFVANESISTYNTQDGAEGAHSMSMNMSQNAISHRPYSSQSSSNMTLKNSYEPCTESCRTIGDSYMYSQCKCLRTNKPMVGKDIFELPNANAFLGSNSQNDVGCIQTAEIVLGAESGPSNANASSASNFSFKARRAKKPCARCQFIRKKCTRAENTGPCESCKKYFHRKKLKHLTCETRAEFLLREKGIVEIIQV